MGRKNQRAKAKQFSDNLRALIQHQGWTQPEAARHLGVSHNTLRKYVNDGLANETEKNHPRLKRICEKLGVSKIEFLWSSNLKPRTQSLLEAEVTSDTVLWQLRQLLGDEDEEPSEVKKIRKAIERAFNSLVCGMNEAKERARGGGYVDKTSDGKLVAKNRRRGKRSKPHDDY